jgi:hypothetical protein
MIKFHVLLNFKLYMIVNSIVRGFKNTQNIYILQNKFVPLPLSQP